MKVVHQSLFYLFLFALLSAPAFAQDDNANEKEVINFSFKDREFKKIFPFDVPFTIHMTDIPVSHDKIFVRLYDKTKRPKVIVDSSVWKRTTPDESQTNLSIWQLKPNRFYEFEIQESASRPLTTTEKDDLYSDLLMDEHINIAIKALADKYIREPSLGYSKILSQSSIELSALIKQAINKSNPSFELKPVDPAEKLDKVSGFIDAISDILSKSSELLGSDEAIGDAKRPDILVANKGFMDKIRATNWGAMVSGDADYSNLIRSINTTSASFTAPIAISITAKVNVLKESIEAAINSVLEFKKAIVEKVVIPFVFTFQVIQTTFRADFVKNSKFYITLDVGIAYAARIDRVLAYSGVNIYFRPVNKAVPLNQFRDFWQGVGVRLSFLVGVTLGSVEKDNIRKGMIDNKALVLGLGCRVVPFLKINGGVFVHYRYDSNPLFTTSRYHTSLSPFVSISLDVDAKTLFSGVGDSIFK